VACGAESVDGSDRGEFAFPQHTHRPEYETMAAFGIMNAVNDLDAVIAVNHWCNQYGLDSISTGATISFAIECYENGLLTKEDTDGIALNWGNASSVMELLHKIGAREEGIGDLLADGVKVAAERIGQGSEQYAVHIDGEEPAMHDPKREIDYAVSYVADPTPARHTLWGPGKASKFPNQPSLPEDKRQPGGRGKRHKVAHELTHVMNSAGMCYFVYLMAPTERVPEWINLVTGWDTGYEELEQVGERIANLRMAFAVKHGNNPARREIPGRVIGDPPQDVGPHEGLTIDVQTMKREWFDEASWDLITSKPSRAKLESLGLADVANAIGV
jgi:aldehyde:ferredoxin oxidoreductase